MEDISVVLVGEAGAEHRGDCSYISSLHGYTVSETTPVSFMLNSINYGTVVVIELPFLHENEEEFLRIVFEAPHIPVVLLTDEPLKYLRYLGRGTVQLVVREPGYQSAIPKAITDAMEGARIIHERDVLEKRLKEYAQYLESINRIMEHDVGDLNQAILTFSELLNRSENRTTKPLIDNIISQSKTVGNLINSFSKLARIAKGNVEDITLRARPLSEAVDQGVSRFIRDMGSDYSVQVECPGDMRVTGDAQLPDLFEYSLSLLSNLQKGCRHYAVSAREEKGLNPSTLITISPDGMARKAAPRILSSVDDIDTLLRGNMDVLAVMMLSRRYGGTVTVGRVEDAGRNSSFLSLLLPLC
ncbi:MAG: hypothetical protein KIY12_06090 [Thermoplasmata archaeon]|uniref:HAMP domain-containing histidine kinase n=1 Tax=Candidatus Sysuiplasma superficiale TaxID=2823368 RepID=A0A8J8CGF0_9ARCH|nr:HAMP domain-containing histidine kinase [Candidatus Sysuiplasma superficiale]MBX8644276.1 hypothetical protein [Candidatus Sysuiplasma superficiale]MCL4347109.1 hypothetical protein [Candidatus Thermoplasmatota archaeon]